MDKKQTEQLIKDTAKHLFFARGQFNARMDDIAREAKLNRALLHYYFRSRENLFEVVLKEAMEESFLKMFAILSSDQPFEAKIRQAVHHIVDCLADYPFIESFIISEINKNPADALSLGPVGKGRDFTKKFLKEVSGYIRDHRLPYAKPEHFIVNMMSLCAYPSTIKPIMQNILGHREAQYRSFILSRKKLLPDIILMKH